VQQCASPTDMQGWLNAKKLPVCNTKNKINIGEVYSKASCVHIYFEIFELPGRFRPAMTDRTLHCQLRYGGYVGLQIIKFVISSFPRYSRVCFTDVRTFLCYNYLYMTIIGALQDSSAHAHLVDGWMDGWVSVQVGRLRFGLGCRLPTAVWFLRYRDAMSDGRWCMVGLASKQMQWTYSGMSKIDASLAPHNRTILWLYTRFHPHDTCVR